MSDTPMPDRWDKLAAADAAERDEADRDNLYDKLSLVRRELAAAATESARLAAQVNAFYLGTPESRLLDMTKERDCLEKELAAVTAERDELLADKVRAQSTINTWLDAIAPSGWVYELRKERDRMRPVVEAAARYMNSAVITDAVTLFVTLSNAVQAYEAATCPSATETP